jgi:hypothetical protein
MTHWMTELQDEVGVWSESNFGDAENCPADLPMIGAGEELGELTRSVLKRAQGIADDEKYQSRDDVGPEAERDAVGDVTIYILDMVHRSPARLNVGEHYAEWVADDTEHLFSTIDRDVDMIRELYGWYGDVTRCAIAQHVEGDDRTPTAIEIGGFLAGLERFCELRGYDYKQCVLDAWEEVSGREWDANVTA